MVNAIEHAIDESGWSSDERDEFLPLTFLTLDRARRELRVPAGDTGQDELIRDQVKSAVSFLVDDLEIPILQETVYTVLVNGNSSLPLKFPSPSDPFVLKATSVAYQDQGADIYTPGDWPLSIEIDEDNQLAPGAGDGNQISGNIIIKPPEGSWPLAASNHYAVYYQRGIKTTYHKMDVLRSLAILKLRDMFFAVGFMKGTDENTAYERLAKTVRYLGTPIQFERID